MGQAVVAKMAPLSSTVGLFAVAGVGALALWLTRLAPLEAPVLETGPRRTGGQRGESSTRDREDGGRMDNGAFRISSPVLPAEPAAWEPLLLRRHAWSACFEVALPVILRGELREASGEWLPSRESLRYWTLSAVEQVEKMSLGCVAGLIGSDDGYSDYVAAQFDAPDLRSVLPLPTDADVDRLWRNASTRRLFEEALSAKYYVGIVDRALEYRLAQLKERCTSEQEFSCVWATDPALRELDGLRSRLLASESASWGALWASDKAVYPHWSFLMRVAQRRFL